MDNLIALSCLKCVQMVNVVNLLSAWSCILLSSAGIISCGKADKTYYWDTK